MIKLNFVLTALLKSLIEVDASNSDLITFLTIMFL